MNLSGDLFASLRAGQAAYQPKDDVSSQLNGKTLLMLVGPTAIGKSTVMNAATKLDDNFRRVSGFTTRAPRANDEPGLYRYIRTDDDYEELIQDIKDNTLVQYAVSPVKDVVYGTYTDDYPAEVNLQDTFYFAVADYQKLPFKKSVAIGIVADPTNWTAWLTERFQPGDNEVLPRLNEAKLCLAWLLEQKDQVKWLRNDDLEAASKRLVAIGLEQEEPLDGSHLAQAMLDAIPELEKRFN